MNNNNNIQNNSINNNINNISNINKNISKKNSSNSSELNNNSNINSTRTKESLLALEKSAEELQSFIDVIAPFENKNTSKIKKLSFRPKNLPQKSKEEEEYHRHLVEENRKLYLEKIKEKQEKEKKIKDKLLERKNKQNLLNKIWQENLIPNWYKIKNSPEIIKYFYLGLPDNIRGKIWILCLGNKFSITKEYYNIEVKKSLEIITEINKKK